MRIYDGELKLLSVINDLQERDLQEREKNICGLIDSSIAFFTLQLTSHNVANTKKGAQRAPRVGTGTDSPEVGEGYLPLPVNSGYASIPHSEISTPSNSSSSVTRIPIIALIAIQTTRLVTNTQTKMVSRPTI